MNANLFTCFDWVGSLAGTRFESFGGLPSAVLPGPRTPPRKPAEELNAELFVNLQVELNPGPRLGVHLPGP